MNPNVSMLVNDVKKALAQAKADAQALSLTSYERGVLFFHTHPLASGLILGAIGGFIAGLVL